MKTVFHIIMEGFTVPVDILEGVQYGVAVERAEQVARRSGRPAHVIGMVQIATCKPPKNSDPQPRT